MNWDSIDDIVAEYRIQYPGLTEFQYLTLAHQQQPTQVLAHVNGVGRNTPPLLAIIHDRIEEVRRELIKNRTAE